MHKTAIILNPNARSARAGGLYETIQALAGKRAVLFRTTQRGEARYLAQQAIERGFQRIIAAGGDGTINEVVNGMAGSDIPLGLLPSGTMNVFAAELNLPKSLEACWEIIQEERIREIDLPLANDRAFVQLAGVGLDAEAVQQTSLRAKRALGALSYVISAAQITASRPPPRLKATPKEGPPREGSFILIGNGHFYGGPFPVFKNASLTDGLLNVLVFHNLGYLDLLRYMRGVLNGSHVSMEDVDYFQTPSLTVTSDRDVPVEVDGEVIGHLPCEFRFHSRPLKVICPAPERSFS